MQCRGGVIPHNNVMLSEAKHLYDCLRDPSLSLRVTWLKDTNLRKVSCLFIGESNVELS